MIPFGQEILVSTTTCRELPSIFALSKRGSEEPQSDQKSNLDDQQQQPRFLQKSRVYEIPKLRTIRFINTFMPSFIKISLNKSLTYDYQHPETNKNCLSQEHASWESSLLRQKIDTADVHCWCAVTMANPRREQSADEQGSTLQRAKCC